ncbi:hypothetical protein OSTOST_25039, partial [Ostertagia ostertagi]
RHLLVSYSTHSSPSIYDASQYSEILLDDYFSYSDIKAIQRIEVAARFGQLCLICYDISIYTHLVISLNRFVSVYMPTHYKAIFTERFTTILIA